MNRGSHAVIDEHDIRILASMRPRFMNRGSVSHVLVDWLDEIASMRPRFMNRGSPPDLRKESQ